MYVYIVALGCGGHHTHTSLRMKYIEVMIPSG